MRLRCNAVRAALPRDAVILAILLVSSALSFWLGYAAGQGGGDSRQDAGAVSSLESGPIDKQTVVASKYGSKYYLATCPGAERITANNRVTFTSAAAAQAAGYSPAANCPGI